MGWLGNLLGGALNAATGGAAGKVWNIAKAAGKVTGIVGGGSRLNPSRGNMTQGMAAQKLAGPMQPKAYALGSFKFPVVMPGGAPLAGGGMGGGMTSAPGTKRKRRRRKGTSSPSGKTRKRGRKKSGRGSSGTRRKAPSAKQKANWARFAREARARRNR